MATEKQKEGSGMVRCWISEALQGPPRIESHWDHLGVKRVYCKDEHWCLGAQLLPLFLVVCSIFFSHFCQPLRCSVAQIWTGHSAQPNNRCPQSPTRKTPHGWMGFPWVLCPSLVHSETTLHNEQAGKSQVGRGLWDTNLFNEWWTE